MLCAALRVIDNDCVLTRAPQEVDGLLYFLEQTFYSTQISLHYTDVISVPEDWHARPKAEHLSLESLNRGGGRE